MNLIGGATGAVIGGAIGAAIWAGIAVGTGYEIGWIAWGVGILAGLGAFLGAKRQGSPAVGGIAVLVAIVALLGGKYATVQLLIDKELGNEQQIIAEEIRRLDDPEVLMSYVADEVVQEYIQADRPVNWPAGVDPDFAYAAGDYPADVWTDAEARWSALSDTERAAYRADLEESIRVNITAGLPLYRADIAKQGFLNSFSPMDAIFFLLAIVTAFKLGAGGSQARPQSQGNAPPGEVQ